jgi:hypothetical protein
LRNVPGVRPAVTGTRRQTSNLLRQRLLTYDSLRMKFGELRLRRDRNCPVCGDHPTIKEYVDYEGFCNIG